LITNVAVAPDLAVLLERDHDLLEARLVAALADPLGIRAGLVARVHLRDALVHLAEELLVFLDPLFPAHPRSQMLTRQV
jgi:hypothetical protein